MSTGIPGKAQRQNVYGNRIDRPTSNLAQTGNLTLFNVTGGRVLITSLIGEVTTAIQAQADAVIIRALGTLGATTTALHNTWDVNGLVLGTLISIPGVAASNVTSGGSVTQNNEFVVPIGSIQMNAAASNTGQIRWTVTYIPLDDGGAVTAA